MRHNERGANLVELAIVTPLLLLLLIGVVDIGWAFHDFIVIGNAAREGARYGSRYPTHTAGIVAAVIKEAAGNQITLAPGDVRPEWPNGSSTGQPIRVTVRYTHTTLIGQILGVGDLSLSTSAQMIIFGQDPPP